MLPKFLGELHPKYKTPHKAILLIGVISTLAPLLGRPALEWLVDAGGLGLVVAWLMVAISFIILRKKAHEMKRPFYLRNWKLIAWSVILFSVGYGVLSIVC